MIKHYSDSFYVLYLIDEFVGFYFLPAVKLHKLITQVCTCGAFLSQSYGFIPHQLSSCNITPDFLHRLVFRAVNHVGRCTFAHRDTFEFLLSRRYLKQWRILGFIIYLCPKGSLISWVLEGHQHILPLDSSTNGKSYLVYLTKAQRL